jgi:Collagenase NC10 and Endostatin.
MEKETLDKETFLREYKGVLVVGIAILILGAILLLNFVLSAKSISLVSGESSFQAGQAYEIKWDSAGISRVGIVLFGGKEPKWIAYNFPAGAEKYVWETDPYEVAGAEYRLAVFEYPWKKGNSIAYSPAPITIIGQKYVSCDSYSVEQEWIHLPDKHPGILRAFITSSAYAGDLGGLAGADEKCNQEAKKNGYQGNYIALLGSDEQSARERVQKDGIFVSAAAAGQSAEGRACYRLVAENVQKLLDKTKLSREAAQIQFGNVFGQGFGNLWLGRMTSSIGAKCLLLGIDKDGQAMFSNGYTCQNWTVGKRLISQSSDADLTRCYDSAGKNLVAGYYGAATVAVNDQGGYTVGSSTCDAKRRLFCVEQ